MDRWTGVLPATAVVEMESIPYLRTEKGSLVFTIAPNGHVWGHRVEEGGTKRDIELEIYAPIEGGYTLKRKGFVGSSIWNTERDLTESQNRAIKRILAQKTLQTVLGTLVLHSSHRQVLKGYYKEYNPSSFGEPCRTLRVTESGYHDIRLADRLSRYNDSRLGFFNIEYLDDEFTFQICGAVADIHLRKIGTKYVSGFGKCGPSDLENLHYRDNYRFFKNSNEPEFPHYVVFAAQAKDKKFFVGNFPACVERHLFPNELTVLCDTENVFDVFQIDDAMLLLEEKRISETESELYWTFAVAKNKKVAELARLLSNNPKASGI